ncbi:MAG: RIP metalloprotease RseP, partial [Pseudomonadota bacterium]
MRPILGTVEQNSPAAHASLKSGSSITSVAGIPVTTWQDVRWEVLQQTIKASSVEVETLSDAHEVHLHQLELSSIGKDDFETDFLAKLGLTPYQPEVPAKIGEIIASGAADKAGLKAGDSILSVNGSPVTTWEELVSTVRKNPGKQLELKIQRGGATSSVAITPDSAIENGKAIGRIGAAYHMEKSELDRILVEVKYSPLLAIEKAARKTWDTSIFSLKMMGSMITGQVSWRGMSGPVTIASYAGQTAHIGWKAFIGFLALVSISLGILNLLPIPVLDGGHLLYYVVEILKGSPVSDRVMEIGQRVGMALLGLLMTCALYNDFNRLITG